MAENRRKDRHSAGYVERFHKETYEQVNFRVRKDSGIIEALELASRMTGITKSGYIRDAVVDRLKDDGYMPEN